MFFGARVFVPEIDVFIIYIDLSLSGEKHFTEIDLLTLILSVFGSRIFF